MQSFEIVILIVYDLQNTKLLAIFFAQFHCCLKLNCKRPIISQPFFLPYCSTWLNFFPTKGNSCNPLLTIIISTYNPKHSGMFVKKNLSEHQNRELSMNTFNFCIELWVSIDAYQWLFGLIISNKLLQFYNGCYEFLLLLFMF